MTASSDDCQISGRRGMSSASLAPARANSVTTTPLHSVWQKEIALKLGAVKAQRDGMPRLEFIFLLSANAGGCFRWRDKDSIDFQSSVTRPTLALRQFVFCLQPIDLYCGQIGAVCENS